MSDELLPLRQKTEFDELCFRLSGDASRSPEAHRRFAVVWQERGADQERLALQAVNAITLPAGVVKRPRKAGK